MIRRHLQAYVNGRPLLGFITYVITCTIIGTICLFFGALQTLSPWYSCGLGPGSTLVYNLRTFTYFKHYGPIPPFSFIAINTYDVCDSMVKDIYGIEICQPMRHGFWGFIVCAIVGSVSALMLASLYYLKNRIGYWILHGLSTVGACVGSLVIAIQTTQWLGYPSYGNPRNIWYWRNRGPCDIDRTALSIVLVGSFFYLLAGTTSLCLVCWYAYQRCKGGAARQNRPRAPRGQDLGYAQIRMVPLEPNENASIAQGEIIEAIPIHSPQPPPMNAIRPPENPQLPSNPTSEPSVCPVNDSQTP